MSTPPRKKAAPKPQTLMEVLADDDTPEAPPHAGAVVDPPSVELPTETPAAPRGKVRVRIVKGAQSAPIAGGHFTLRSGEIMNLDASVAEALVRERYAVEI